MKNTHIETRRQYVRIFGAWQHAVKRNQVTLAYELEKQLIILRDQLKK